MVRADFTYFSRLFAILIIYFVTARLGLMVDAVGGFATLVWLPTGISLAALLILGVRFWPAIALGAFLANFSNGAPLPAALGISFGNTLEAVIGFYLLKNSGFNNSLKKLSDVLFLIFFAAVCSTFISATIGTTSLLLTGVISYSQYFSTWSAWWIGDMVSSLIVAPMILVFSNNFRAKVSQKVFLEILLYGIFLVLISLIVFTGLFFPDLLNAPIRYLVFLPIIWAALRFGQKEVVASVFVLSAVALTGTLVYMPEEISENLILLQSFMVIFASTSMILGSVIEERRTIEKRKDDFISVASHELKTPVTSIKGYAELLEQRFIKTRDSKAIELVKKMDFQIIKLINLINDLLDVSKIESGKMKFYSTRIDLNEFLDEIVEEMQMTTSKHLIIKKFDDTRVIYADRERLEQVVVNIIGNAIKYSPKKGKIIVKTLVNAWSVTVSVQDYGIGISKNAQEKVFERYYQAEDNLANSSPSIGLGLYISSKIIKKFGGKIWVKSRKGRGSTFYFSIPIKVKS